MKKYLLVALAILSCSAYAWQPDKNTPITVITGYPAGSSNEIIFRKLATVVTANTGVNFIVKPKPGVDGIIAMNELYDSKPDGYSVAVPSIPTLFVVNDISNKNLKKYSWDSFATPIVIGQTPLAVIASAKNPVTNFKQLTDLLKTTTQPINIGQAGGTIRVAYEYLMHETNGNKKMVKDIGYKSFPPEIADVVGGQIDFGITTLSSVYQIAKDGRVRILAITEESSNSTEFPKTYTTLPNYKFSTGYLLALPPKTDLEIQQWYSREFIRAMRDPEFQQWATDNLITTDINLTSDIAVKAFGAQMRKKLSRVMTELSKGEN